MLLNYVQKNKKLNNIIITMNLFYCAVFTNLILLNAPTRFFKILTPPLLR